MQELIAAAGTSEDQTRTFRFAPFQDRVYELPVAMKAIGRSWHWPSRSTVRSWTGDSDFFGYGVATWTTDRAELYLNERPWSDV